MALEHIKIPYAERRGELVHISTFDKGGLKPDCRCLVCKKSLVARIGTQRVHHFAHPPDVQPCNPETVLHQLGKQFLAQRIEQALAAGKPLRVQWECEECGEDHHTDDVLKEIVSLVVEGQFGPVRPDLALRRQDGGTVAVFEIIVSHPPEPETLAFYKARGVKVWQITLTSVEEAESLNEPDGVLSVVAAANYCPLPPLPYCPDPDCREHSQKMAFRSLRVPSVPCWNCRQEMKAAFVQHGSGSRDDGPEAFTPEELTRACAAGAVFYDRRSPLLGKTVPANACLNCRSHIGVGYYHHYISEVASAKVLARVSYGCETCGIFWPVGGSPPPPASAPKPNLQPDPAAAPVPQNQSPLTIAPINPVYPAGCPDCGKNLKRRFLYVRWRYPERRHTTEDIAVVMLGRYGLTFGPSTFTARELQAAEEHGADTADRGRMFYEHHAEILQSSQPVGSYSQGCSQCGKVVPDQP